LLYITVENQKSGLEAPDWSFCTVSDLFHSL